jgi:stage IV sporulation protein FA
MDSKQAFSDIREGRTEMDRMDELRKRRQQRIQHILNGTDDEYGPGRSRTDGSKEHEHERKLREDPEYQWYTQGNPWSAASSKIEGTLRIQAIVSVVAFAAVWAIFQWEHPTLTKAQTFVRTALTEEVQLDKAYAWYEERYGPVPSFIPVLDRVPVKAERVQGSISRTYITPIAGSIVEPFGGVRSGAGIVVRASGSAVAAMDTGLVLFAGETKETGMTVVIRHPDGVESVYGYLGELHVTKEEWVEAGDSVGRVRRSDTDAEEGLLYFAVKKGNSFIDPTDVVAI